MTGRRWAMVVATLSAVALFAGGCAAGSERFMEGPAGFWAGLWHGLIVIIAFIVSLFVDGVRIYELRNTGHLYDLGFVVGAIISLGATCGHRRMKWCRPRRRLTDRDADEIAQRIADRVKGSPQA